MRTELEHFLQGLKLRVAPTTYTRKEWQIRSFYHYLLDHQYEYTQVTKEIVEAYLQSHSCSTTAKRQLAYVISEFYNFMQVPNPVKDIHFQREKSPKLPNIPSEISLEAIINTFDHENTILSQRNRFIIELAYGSGLRRSEMVKLNINDIDLEERTIYIKGKGGKNRIVPITEKAVTCMREYLAKRKCWTGPLLVSNHGRRLSKEDLYRIIKNSTNLKLHQLRHACAGHMLRNGCSTRVIQELLGHKKLSTTQIYTQISKDHLKEVINTKHPRSM